MEHLQQVYTTELEVLLGKLISGDLTPIVYTLLKDTPYKECLLEYLKGAKPDVCTKQSIKTEDSENNNGESLAQWFSQFERV